MGRVTMRTLLLWPSVELSMGPRNVRCAPKWAWQPCEPRDGGLRWSSLWRREACDGCAEKGR
eukprot:4719628-Pyramimonas_sp.AAC.1